MIAGSIVRDIIRAFEAASGKRIPYEIKPRRSEKPLRKP
jgi:UDP-glucose 4-epimerase